MAIRGVLIRVLLYAACAALLLVYMMFQGSQYDWMEPTSLAKNIEDNSKNRDVIRVTTVFIALIMQFMIAICLSRKEAIVSVAIVTTIFYLYW
jgi:hypothetical protein